MSEHKTVFETEGGWIEMIASEKGITSIVLPRSERTGRKNGRGTAGMPETDRKSVV